MPSTDHGRRDALPVGTVLREFTIQAVIGHGGFGIVYRAGHNELDLTVAIKEYLPVELAVREGATVQPRSGTERKDFAEGLRRFRDEAQALIDFDSHPSIVSCREFFRAHGTAYLVMGYEDGESLAEVLARREAEGRPFAAADLLGVMRPVLEGLERVHAAGVLHRDIKPSNILIRRRDGRPVLIDFGAAKQATARFSKSQAPYTEGYAALEQVADAGKLGPWTDMYGVGAVMWRMVAGGKRPWEPPHPVRVEQRSHAALGGTEDPMPSARELGEGRFPSQMLEVIDRCLRLRETERMQGSRELLEALRVGSELLSGGSPDVARQLDEQASAKRQEAGSHAVPTGASPRTGWRRGVWPVLASLVVGLGLLLAAWWSFGSEEAARDQMPAGASDGLGSESTAPGRWEVVDSVPSPDQPTEDRESPLEASGTAQDPDPTGIESGRKEEVAEAESGRDSEDSLAVQPEGSRDSVAQPWIRDWDALGDIRDPGFVATARAYIEQYREVSEASVWVAKAEGLLAELRELEAASTTQREAGETWMISLGMEFVWIPAGDFLMGSPEDEEGRDGDEGQHEVRISEGYWMKKYEVTQGEWEAVMGTNPSYFSACGPRCPVEGVSWDDTQEFIRRMNSRGAGSGSVYRLPTEGEWEYAARAGSARATPGGDLRILGERNAPELDGQAWYGGNSGVAYRGGYDCSGWEERQYESERCGTHAVGQKRANAWGLHDMLGNVWEWTGDWYGPYPSGPVTDPGGPESGSDRVARGGSWLNVARAVRSALRYYDSPGSRLINVGFRLVRTE